MKLLLKTILLVPVALSLFAGPSQARNPKKVRFLIQNVAIPVIRAATAPPPAPAPLPLPAPAPVPPPQNVVPPAPPPALPVGPSPQPLAPAPATVITRPPTIFEFARSVRPLPGKYDVVLCHPYTGRPVRACFTLPPGCVKVVVRKKLFNYEIDFDYGNCEIELNFGRRGGFRVDYND